MPRAKNESANDAVKTIVVLDDGNNFVSAEMPSDAQNKELLALERATKNKNIMFGKVVGVVVGNSPADEPRLIVKVDTIRVFIPASDFFYYSEMKDLDAEDKEGRAKRYRRKANHMFEAAVCFIPLAVATDADGVPFAVASRRRAMEALQYKHFFSPKADACEGARVVGSVVSTGPRYITVECLGLEKVIGTGALSAFTFIEDASEHYKVGDGISLMIESLKVDKENKVVDIGLSHAALEREDAKVEQINSDMIGNRYKGTVTAVLPNMYVILPLGFKFSAQVLKSNFKGEGELITGEKVVFTVTDIKDERTVYAECLRA